MDIAQNLAARILIIGQGALLSYATQAANLEVGGNLEVKNNTEIKGALEVKDNTEIKGDLRVVSDANLIGTLSVSGATTVSDDFSLDTNGTNAGGSLLSADDSAINLQSGGGSTTIKGGTQSGIWYLNDGDASNTGGPDGTALTISGSASSNPAATVFQTTTDAQTTQVTTRVGTSNTLYSQSQVYTQAGNQQILIDSISGINATAHNGQMQMLLNQVQLSSGGMGINSFATSRNLSSNSSTSTLQQLQYGNSFTRNTLQGLSINNQLAGNTSIDGHFYVNGNVNIAATTSSQVKVVNSTGSAGLNTTGAGTSGLIRDHNGGLINGTSSSNATSLSVKSASGYNSGMLVEYGSLNFSSGYNNSTMRLDSNGLTLSNSSTGAPIPIHGVAPGSAEYDAVNYGQLKDAHAGIASNTAAANIPQSTADGSFVGIGVGGFANETAIAVGIRTLNQNLNMSAAATVTYDSRGNLGVGIGVGWGF